MVDVKVTFGGETRRFISSTELNYDELIKKVSNLFPSLRESSLKLELTYRDEDGDLVTLSSDEEVAAALSTIATGKTWRLQARQIRPASTKTPLNPLLFSLLRPGHLSPSSTLHRLLHPFSLDSYDTLLSDGLSLFEKLRFAEQKASAEHRASQQKQAQQEATSSKDQQHQAKPAEKAAQEPSSTSASCSSSSSSSPRISLSPIVAGCPFWTSSLFGPVGYEIRWSWSPEANQENNPKAQSSKQPGEQPEPAKETGDEPTPDQPLEEPQKEEEETQPGEAAPTAIESVSA